ncbi:NAD(P)/FAD-dependent oxidoreductase [Streptomyces durmitorensis]|uniref:FAD-dependent monooxygenase n=1 Tax=Streptomyces durmitorensis TaxID=319947 RepID=A0ABY4Q6K2_9ACTN|nr:FAD-dependent monooxygenase [Streptomyces durmitorensis]UQT60777.1 FAD-dependent monooxygenase [Streptomyces durmitorensis]
MPKSPAITALPCRTDVLISGAGPTGLTLAAGLRRLGVDHVLIDRNAGIQPGSKAAAVQPRALEYLDRIGVGTGLVKDGHKARGFCLHDRDRTLLRACYDRLDTPHPYMLLASQQTTEEHLVRQLAELGGTVHREHRLVGFAVDFPGVTVTVAGPDGVLRAVTTRYLVGCDGVHSQVRDAVGIGFPGQAPEQLFALADVYLKPGARAAVSEGATFFLSGAGLLLVSPLAGDLYRLVAPVSSGSPPPDAKAVEHLLARRGPVGGTGSVDRVVTASTYRTQERVAEQFRSGPVFLAGDAAHTHSPAGAQGMNTGIQDAGNLAWKLHAVLTGIAPEALLDTYHRERQPVAAQLVALTGQFSRIAALADPAAGRRRNALLVAAAATEGITDWLAATLAQLDVAYTSEPDLGVPRPGTRVSPVAVPPDGLHWTLALPGTPRRGITASGHGVLAVRYVPDLPTTLLVRPDGYLAAAGVPDSPAKVIDRIGEYLPLAQ